MRSFHPITLIAFDKGIDGGCGKININHVNEPILDKILSITPSGWRHRLHEYNKKYICQVDVCKDNKAIYINRLKDNIFFVKVNDGDNNYFQCDHEEDGLFKLLKILMSIF